MGTPESAIVGGRKPKEENPSSPPSSRGDTQRWKEKTPDNIRQRCGEEVLEGEEDEREEYGKGEDVLDKNSPEISA